MRKSSYFFKDLPVRFQRPTGSLLAERHRNDSAISFTHVGKGTKGTVLRLNGKVFFRFLFRDLPADFQNLLPVVFVGQCPFAPVPQIVKRGFRNVG